VIIVIQFKEMNGISLPADERKVLELEDPLIRKGSGADGTGGRK
jgi:hypothetical protein